MTMRNRNLPPEEAAPLPDSSSDPASEQPAEITGMPATSPPPKNRLTVVETVYHQTFGEQPLSVDSRFERELRSDEQMYQRRKVATEEWQPLDLGWVADPGTVVIQNTEGQFLQLVPTPEQRAETKQKALLINYADREDGSFYVPPGESFRFSHSDFSLLRIRCQQGTAKYTISVIPA